MFIDFRETRRERNIDRWPPIRALTRDWTYKLLVHGTMSQPTEPPGQGIIFFLVEQKPKLFFWWRISWNLLKQKTLWKVLLQPYSIIFYKCQKSEANMIFFLFIFTLFSCMLAFLMIKIKFCPEIFHIGINFFLLQK